MIAIIGFMGFWSQRQVDEYEALKSAPAPFLVGWVDATGLPHYEDSDEYQDFSSAREFADAYANSATDTVVIGQAGVIVYRAAGRGLQ